MLSAGANALRFAGPREIGGSAMLTREYSRYFYDRDGWNLHLSVDARYRVPLR